jgi:hypothetical protein
VGTVEQNVYCYASRIDLEEFRRLYPAFLPEDELIVQWGEMSCGVSSMKGAARRETEKKETDQASK